MENTAAAVKTETEIKDQNQTSSPELTVVTAASSGQLETVDAIENGSTDMACTPEPQETLDENAPPMHAVESPPSTSDKVSIDPVQKEKLETLFAETINSHRFWANPKRVERLEQALNLPMFDDRSLQQFYISASDELYKEAAKLSAKNGTAAEIPSEEKIRARAMEKHEAKMAQLAKKAKKAEKSEG